MRIYISGPITKDPDYKIKFARARETLQTDGQTVIDPSELDLVLPADASHEEYMRVCLKLLDIADAVYMLSGWADSHGASIEYGYALAQGKAVLFQDDSEQSGK